MIRGWAKKSAAPLASVSARQPRHRPHVSASFFGHDRNYQHYLKNGVHYFITGGGAPLYDVDLPPAGITEGVASVENIMIVQVDGNAARLEARTPDGTVLEVTQLSATSGAPISGQ